MYDIVKLNAFFYDEQSIFNHDEFDGDVYYYLPDENIKFKDSKYNKQDIERFYKTFEKLDENNYLTLKPVVAFNITNLITLFNNEDSDFSLSEINFKILYEDFKKIPDFNKFGTNGVSFTTFCILIKEHWSQCWEGDYDCYMEYLGVINQNNLEQTINVKKEINEYI